MCEVVEIDVVQQFGEPLSEPKIILDVPLYKGNN